MPYLTPAQAQQAALIDWYTNQQKQQWMADPRNESLLGIDPIHGPSGTPWDLGNPMLVNGNITFGGTGTHNQLTEDAMQAIQSGQFSPPVNNVDLAPYLQKYQGMSFDQYGRQAGNSGQVWDAGQQRYVDPGQQSTYGRQIIQGSGNASGVIDPGQQYWLDQTGVAHTGVGPGGQSYTLPTSGQYTMAHPAPAPPLQPQNGYQKAPGYQKSPVVPNPQPVINPQTNMTQHMGSETGFDGTSYDATTPPAGGDPNAVPFNPYPGGQETLGGGMFPWLQQYQGPFTAGPSQQQTGLYGQFQNTLNQGPGWSPSNTSYLADSDLKKIQSNAQTLKDYEDAQALRKMQSSASAGGNALSGALLQNEQDYLRNSGAGFNQMMGNLGLQSGLANRGMSIQENLGNAGLMNQAYGTRLGGLNSLLNQYNTQQGITNQGLGLQYGDFLRQIQGMNQAYNYPAQLAYQTLHSGPGGANQPQYGNSTLDQILSGLSQSGVTGAVADWLKKLLGIDKTKQTDNQPKPGGGAGPGGGPGGGSGGGNRPGEGSQPGQPPGQTPDNSPIGDTGPNGEPIRTDEYGQTYYTDNNGNQVYGFTDDNGNFTSWDDYGYQGGFDPNDPSNWGSGPDGGGDYGGDYGGGDYTGG